MGLQDGRGASSWEARRLSVYTGMDSRAQHPDLWIMGQVYQGLGPVCLDVEQALTPDPHLSL